MRLCRVNTLGGFMTNVSGRRIGIPRVMLLCGFALIALIGASVPARVLSLELNQGAPYLCANVQSGNTTPGTPIIAAQCSGSFAQTWNFTNGAFWGLGSTNGSTKMC